MKSLFLFLILLLLKGLSLPSVSSKGFLRPADTIKNGKTYGIIGGKSAEINEYPFMVSLTYAPENILIGSGAILNKNWIVCSAYQALGFTPGDISVRVGSSEVDKGGQQLNVSKIIIHEDYTEAYQCDVALFKTSSDITLGTTARPVKLAKTKPKQGTEAKVVGFGSYTNETMVSGKLQVGSVRVNSDKLCREKHGYLGGNTAFCADADGVGPCYDDYGDPLVHNNQLLGCYIGGDICNIYGVPEIYSNIPKLRKWILTKIKENSDVNDMEAID